MPERTAQSEAPTREEEFAEAAELADLLARPVGSARQFEKVFQRILAPGIGDLLQHAEDPNRVMQLGKIAIARQPKLANCTGLSIVRAIMEAVSLDLDVSGVYGEAYLVPYKDEATLQIGYQGFKKLAYNHPKVLSVEAHVVYTADEFEYEYGVTPKLRHVPAETNRGRRRAAWAMCRLRDCPFPIFWVMPADEVESHRKRSRAAESGTGPWVTDPDAMWCKTAFRVLRKWLPHSKALDMAFALDARDDTQLGDATLPVTDSDEALDRFVEAKRAGKGGTAQLKHALGVEPEPAATPKPAKAMSPGLFPPVPAAELSDKELVAEAKRLGEALPMDAIMTLKADHIGVDESGEVKTWARAGKSARVAFIEAARARLAKQGEAEQHAADLGL